MALQPPRSPTRRDDDHGGRSTNSSSSAMGSMCISVKEYGKNLCENLQLLRNQTGLVDLDIVVEDAHIHVHKVVMAASSKFFKEHLCRGSSGARPAILKLEDFGLDLKRQAVSYLIEFVYNGEVTIPGELLSSICEAAHSLGIYGLVDFLPAPFFNNSNTSRQKRKSGCGRPDTIQRERTASSSERLDQEVGTAQASSHGQSGGDGDQEEDIREVNPPNLISQSSLTANQQSIQQKTMPSTSGGSGGTGEPTEADVIFEQQISSSSNDGHGINDIVVDDSQPQLHHSHYNTAAAAGQAFDPHTGHFHPAPGNDPYAAHHTHHHPSYLHHNVPPQAAPQPTGVVAPCPTVLPGEYKGYTYVSHPTPTTTASSSATPSSSMSSVGANVGHHPGSASTSTGSGSEIRVKGKLRVIEQTGMMTENIQEEASILKTPDHSVSYSTTSVPWLASPMNASLFMAQYDQQVERSYLTFLARLFILFLSGHL